ncbi:hypothetical protein SAMN06309944_0173 [Micrococcales bacterium KH10]|nr:hypothetical protein SAMN06309944_0173 [Micrococcales bacterium KH10]
MTSPEITIREVFDGVQEIKQTLAGMQGHKDTLDDHETRIRGLEKLVWKAAGVAATVGAALGWLIPLLLA